MNIPPSSGSLSPRELARLSRESANPKLRPRELDPDRSDLDATATSCRNFGVFLALLGCVPVGIAQMNRWSIEWDRLLAGFDTIALVGPAAWYVVVSFLIRRHHRRVITPTLYVGVAQLVVLPLMLFAVFLYGARDVPFVLVPALLGILFTPALGVLVARLRRARHTIDSLAPTETAFRPIVAAVRVGPVTGTDRNA